MYYRFFDLAAGSYIVVVLWFDVRSTGIVEETVLWYRNQINLFEQMEGAKGGYDRAEWLVQFWEKGWEKPKLI